MRMQGGSIYSVRGFWHDAQGWPVLPVAETNLIFEIMRGFALVNEGLDILVPVFGRGGACQGSFFSSLHIRHLYLSAARSQPNNGAQRQLA